MAGIYIHVPFCRHKCIYCDFYSETAVTPDKTYTDAILKELHERFADIPAKKLTAETVYFGGGTPSLLPAADIVKILSAVSQFFTLSSEAEITLEANPDDINLSVLKAWRAAGINRLSIGIQSFNDRVLKFLKRRHNARQALQALSDAQKVGFDNISGDLIYSIPGMSTALWRETLNTFFSFDIPHLSAYDLIYENTTPLYSQLKKAEVLPVKDEKSAEFFTILRNESQVRAYEHYELSNLAKSGYRSRHNSLYWQGKEYFGIGPAAHSYFGRMRRWNTANLAVWKKRLAQAGKYYDNELLSNKDLFNEYIITRLRTAEGLALDEISSEFGEPYTEYLYKFAAQKPFSNYFIINNKSLVLKKSVWFLSDAVIVELITDKAL